ncbi:plasmid pRiA4b ORF-3 family protein [Flexivirga caeni]|uniref:Plasmid pRiA4b ORF-3 family protein n=1 Tax=Flexivirga caeni TaxID=2294115 RepID=A0A3M9MFC8_9MICO|nr:plasmid pRiA4b ORF-3 family protein [Flexivirga caeni]RNI24246.1 plasmid pRiA4b ORF-3 family protein [Flexivirga caeni]
MPKKKNTTDPQLQALPDQVARSGDPSALISALARQVQGGLTDFDFGANPEIELPDPPLHPLLITVRVDIDGARPPIWRRLELRGDLRLDVVHQHLQAAFGWLDSHLHRFDGPDTGEGQPPYFITDFDAADGETGTHERGARFDQVLRAEGEKLCYTYDFGDNWEHILCVEAVRPATDDDPPAQCTGGRNACPPEDVGGIWQWNELAAALRADPDPAHLSGDLRDYAGWLPADCDPGKFSLDDANLAISRVGASPDEVLQRFEEADLGPSLPEPGPELTALLNRCRPELVRDLAGITTRAMTLAEDPTEEDWQLTLRPWQAVLDAIGDDGVQLSAAGWMPPSAVQQIWQTSGVAWEGGKGNRENVTPEVAQLREECARAGLIRKYKGRLQLTKLGRLASTDRTALTEAVTRSLVGAAEDVEQDIRVATLLFIAARWQVGPNSRWAADAAARGVAMNPIEHQLAFTDDVAHLLTEIGWTLTDGSPLHRDDLGPASGEILGLLGAGRGERYGVPDSPAARRLARLALFA